MYIHMYIHMYAARTINFDRDNGKRRVKEEFSGVENVGKLVIIKLNVPRSCEDKRKISVLPCQMRILMIVKKITA